jgi:DNA replication protein DnaD
MEEYLTLPEEFQKHEHIQKALNKGLQQLYKASRKEAKTASTFFETIASFILPQHISTIEEKVKRMREKAWYRRR